MSEIFMKKLIKMSILQIVKEIEKEKSDYIHIESAMKCMSDYIRAAKERNEKDKKEASQRPDGFDYLLKKE